MAQQSGRAERFEAVAAQVVDPLRRFLARRADPDNAEDALAETLVVVWRRLDDVPAGEEALPWVYAVARNCLANLERGERRLRRLRARIAVVDPPAETAAVSDPPDPRVAEVLGRLRPEQAEVLRLWAWEDLAPAEIARVLGISANAASVRLHRARTAFREIWPEL